MEEEWKDIKGYERKYQVSNKGNVRSLDRVSAKGRKLEGRMLTGKDNKASRINVYQLVSLSGKSYYIHRLVGQAFIDNPENKAEINHIDCDKRNNDVSNLEWCTRKENMEHASRNGLLSLRSCIYAIDRSNKHYISIG